MDRSGDGQTVQSGVSQLDHDTARVGIGVGTTNQAFVNEPGDAPSHAGASLFVEVSTDILSRISPFVAAVGPALPSDPQSVAARDQGRDEFFRVAIDRLAALRALRDGLTPSRALDIIRVVNTVEAYADLTTRRGWTVVEWKQWLTNLLCVQLLADL